MDFDLTDLKEKQEPVVVVGLGYVGLPLATLLASKYRVIGFDIDQDRVSQLHEGVDKTGEISSEELDKRKDSLIFTTNPSYIKESRLIIVTVPTPIDKHKKPDLGPLVSASTTIGANLKQGSVIVYESTVYPGCTEKDCREVLEKTSGLVYKKDFFLGYSPERVNPGDKTHTIDKITKVISGSTPEVAQLLEGMYGEVISAGLHVAPNIATAEAAKVIENTQRDLNIALINELAIIFEKIGLDTRSVLEAAGTKWNFLRFEPGLVGGHCIGVDPYYLTHMAEGKGLHPQVVLAGRRINDGMAQFVANKTIKSILAAMNGQTCSQFVIAVLGVTFKEDVPDLRNTKILDVVRSLEEFGAKVFCVDPVCCPKDFEMTHQRTLVEWDDVPKCHAVIHAVKHETFREELTLEKIKEKFIPNSHILIDLKGQYDYKETKELQINLWRL